MAEAYIAKDVITWGCNRCHLELKDLASKLGVPIDKLEAWDKGSLRPTWNQAQDLAHHLKIPFGYLYLKNRPDMRLPLPDLRSGMKRLPTPSPDFLEAIYDALRKQDWYRENLKDEGAEALPFIGRFGITDNPLSVAEDIRNTLRINVWQRPKSKSWESFLDRLIDKVEESRILVVRTTVADNNNYRKLDEDEFKGFALSDKLAPIIFVNANDYITAQIFTLMHEVAHLWIGESGISNPNYSQKQQDNRIERICDAIAAEVLVPKDNFELRWEDSDTPSNNIANLAVQYRVSQFVVLRRAFTLDKIDYAEFMKLYSKLLQNITIKRSTPGGNTLYTTVIRNSPTFTNTIIAAVASGKAFPTEASHLLNVKIHTLTSLESLLGFRSVSA